MENIDKDEHFLLNMTKKYIYNILSLRFVDFNLTDQSLYHLFYKDNKHLKLDLCFILSVENRHLE